MNEDELIQEFRKNFKTVGSVSELNSQETISLIDKLSIQYIEDRTHIWWWESLREPPVILNYGDDRGWDYFPKLVQPTEQHVYLIATDDNPEPWPVIKGSLIDIVTLLENMWRFEYVIAAMDLSWLVFDTHHNSLVVIGNLKKNANSLDTFSGAL